MRDITLGDTFRHHFTTRQFSDGVPTTLSGSPVVSVLEGGNATPITAGVSISVDRASVGGLNEATIIATSANGYEAGKSYSIYISTGTVGGVSVVGEVVGNFTIALSAAAVDLANSTDGLSALKTLIDNAVSATGTADSGTTTTMVDAALTESDPDYWAGSWIRFTSGSISGQTRLIIAFTPASDTVEFAPATTQPVGTNTYEILPAGATGVDWGNVLRKTTANDLLATDINVCDTTTTATNLTTNNDKSGYQLSAAGVDDIFDEVLSGHVGAGTAGVVLNDWLDGNRLDVILDARMAEASINTTGGAVDTVTTLTGHTAQTGDSFARIGAAGASLTDLGGMSTGMKAEVNVEALDVLNTDTITLPGQVAPPLTPTHREAVGWMFKVLRNRKDQTATLWQLYADNESTVDAKATVSDDGTTAIKQEIVVGP